MRLACRGGACFLASCADWGGCVSARRSPLLFTAMLPSCAIAHPTAARSRTQTAFAPGHAALAIVASPRIWPQGVFFASMFWNRRRKNGYNGKPMFNKQHISQAFSAALPIVFGLHRHRHPPAVFCASPLVLICCRFSCFRSCSIRCRSVHDSNMYLAASPLASIVASVSLVNTRQMLYSASFAPECKGVSKRLAFFFAATVTDESYGVSTARFREGDWSVDRALWVNIFSQTSWTVSNMVGVLVGGAIGIPLNIAAFAMTSIFICLLVSQRMTSANVVAFVASMLGVCVCKIAGLTGPAILIGRSSAWRRLWRTRDGVMLKS